MKRVMLIALACLLLCGLAACGGSDRPNPDAPTMDENAPPTTDAPELTTQIVEAATDPNFDAQALFKRLEGVWNTPHPELEGILGFMSFIYKDGKPILYGGVYDGESSGVGTLIGGRESEDGIAVLYFQYPAVDDWPGPYPERTDALQIDLTGIDDGELRIQQTTIWYTYDWRTFTYRCKTLREAGISAF